MTSGVITADFVEDVSDGPMVRLAGDAASVAVLRDAFDRLGSGKTAVFEFVHGATITFNSGQRGGMRRVADDEFVFDGTADQWESRARLLDPLTQPGEGFQYLDYDGAGDVGVVVTTYPDAGF